MFWSESTSQMLREFLSSVIHAKLSLKPELIEWAQLFAVTKYYYLEVSSLRPLTFNHASSLEELIDAH